MRSIYEAGNPKRPSDMLDPTNGDSSEHDPDSSSEIQGVGLASQVWNRVINSFTALKLQLALNERSSADPESSTQTRSDVIEDQPIED